MTAVPENWIDLANAGREAWWALSACEREELLLEVRFEPVEQERRMSCEACSDCTREWRHPGDHDCDCADRWKR